MCDMSVSAQQSLRHGDHSRRRGRLALRAMRLVSNMHFEDLRLGAALRAKSWVRSHTFLRALVLDFAPHVDWVVMLRT
jgi:hypothetical protein